MRATPFWQPFLQEYDRLTLLNMSIHHIDIFRFLFGDPEKVIASVRSDPRTKFRHTDGIVLYILEYASGLRAMSLDDTWAWAGEGTEKDIFIRWRGGRAVGPSTPCPPPAPSMEPWRSSYAQWRRIRRPKSTGKTISGLWQR
jgi:predicted dehydrogenase